ncbi:Phage late control protein D3 [Neorhizobium galegae bv. orientalis]|nr:Phage late control protein D3 [Neorhizobium galegae bv. orientalis]
MSFTDNDGGDADDFEIEFAVSAPFPASPAEGTRYQLFYGGEGGWLRNGGQFTYQSDSLTGDAESGYLRNVVARSADFVDADKASDTEHFEKITVGEIVNQVASKTGKTASGQELPAIAVAFDQVISFEISSEGRGKFKDVEAPYFDPLEGGSEALEGGRHRRAVPVPWPPSGTLRRGGKSRKQAQAGELGRGTISGSVTMEDSDEAMAGAPVNLSGFGASRDGLDLVASSIQHEWSFDEGGGWLMTIELANRKTRNGT